MKNDFCHAKPIWPDGQEQEMHLRVQFKAVVPDLPHKKAEIRLATSGIYQLIINGRFVAYGPARAGKGHFRVDCRDISEFLSQPQNTVVVEVCSYCVNGFYVQDQPAFLQAEVLCDGEAIQWTGRDFTARRNPHYIRKTQRYSYQRPMVEAYTVVDGDTYLTDLQPGTEPLSEVAGGILEPRLTPYPRFEVLQARRTPYAGSVAACRPEAYRRDRSVTDISPVLRGYTHEELELCVTDEFQQMNFTPGAVYDGHIPSNAYEVYALPCNRTGMITCSLSCEAPTTLYVLFDELLTESGTVNSLRMGSANIVKYRLPAGHHDLRFFEVYTAQYIQLVTAEGCCTVEYVGMIEYKRPPVTYQPKISDPELSKIADAAVETFLQNTVDILMDCPSRERAGWLCDSYFTGQAEYLLTGGNDAEKAFLENFLHEDSYLGVDDGMLPMCYPADHDCGEFIPNWAMWLVLELRSYLSRTDDRDLIDRYREKVMKILSYFVRYENSDGLLEKLDGVVFVDASRSNQLGQDVNYPTNMIYAGMLEAAHDLYGMPELPKKAAAIKKEVLRQSYNGSFFVDNAIRKNGVLVPSGESTESGQYYAFLFDVANERDHGQLLQTLVQSFGPGRDTDVTYPEVAPSNAFMGYYLRLDMLKKFGCLDALKETIRGYFGWMAELTGTLWEYRFNNASCNHGIASYVLCMLEHLRKNGAL